MKYEIFAIVYIRTVNGPVSCVFRVDFLIEVNRVVSLTASGKFMCVCVKGCRNICKECEKCQKCVAGVNSGDKTDTILLTKYVLVLFEIVGVARYRCHDGSRYII